MRRNLSPRSPSPLALPLALSLLGCSGPPPARLTSGDVTLEVLPGERALRLLRGGEALLTLPADGLQLATVPALDARATYDPYWMEYGEDVLPPAEPEGLRWHAPASMAVVEEREGGLTAELSLDGGGGVARLRLQPLSDGRFSALLEAGDAGARRVVLARLRARVGDREGLYGLGEWADEVNHRGKVRPMQMELDATESANNENHVPVPLLLGSRGWALFVPSRRVGVFAVANKEPDLVEVTYSVADLGGAGAVAGEPATGLPFVLFAAAHPLDLLRPYYELTGYPTLPAPWALGPWIWRDENRDQAQVLDDIAKIRALDLATSAIWIDRPYATAVNSFDFKREQFPDPPAMIQAAHDAGLRVALWHTPYVEKSAGALRKEAVDQGFFPKRSGVLLNGWSEPVDFTSPAVYGRWQELIRRYTALGIEGFKLDYAEDVVPGIGAARNVWQFADGSDERVMHHGYTPLYHRAYAEALPAEGEGGGFLLCRAGRWGGQRYASVIWPGDMDASFTRHKERYFPDGPGGKEVVGVGGLPATVVQGLSLSASGYPFFGADTGGYRHSPPDRELFVRWFQQTALSGVMQVGDSSSTSPWEYATGKDGKTDEELLGWYRAYARLHLRLFPYEWTFAQRLKRDGRPVLRPLGLAYPELGVHPSDSYLFGEDLLVAPVLERGQRRRAVILPPGRWLDWADGAVHDGGAGGRTVEVDAPLGKLPLLLREGAAVPLLRPTIDTLAPAQAAGVESFAARPGPLTWRVFPSSSAAETAFTLYDGGELRQRGAVLTIKAGAVFREETLIERLGGAAPARVLLDGQELPRRATVEELAAAASGWARTEALGGTLWLKAPPGDHTLELR